MFRRAVFRKRPGESTLPSLSRHSRRLHFENFLHVLGKTLIAPRGNELYNRPTSETALDVGSSRRHSGRLGSVHSMRSSARLAAILSFGTPRILIRFLAILIPSICLPLLVIADLSLTPRLVIALVLMAGGVAAALLYLRRSLATVARRSAYFEQMFNAVPCYVAVLDHDLRILWADSLFRSDFGAREGWTCHQAYLGSDSRCSDCSALKTFADGGIHSREQTVTTQGGQTTNLIIYSAPLYDRSHTIVAVIEIGVNITSVKAMNKQLLLMGQVIAGMAHSIKNIMMGLDGGIYVVNRGLEAKDQGEVKEGWDIVQLNFEKISKLVRDILYCSKDREPNFQTLQPNKVIQEVHDLYKDSTRSYDIELSLELDDGLDQAVMDPEGLHTVMANLVTNAMDACKVDLWKDSHLITLKSQRGSDGSTIIEVTDNGVGMDDTVKDRAFEDLFTSKGHQGTGLGLMVTQKIMEEHGGTITFQSAPAKGTTFTVVFPPRTGEAPVSGD